MSYIRCKRSGREYWLYVSSNGILVRDVERAERMTGDEAGRRLLRYLNDYPGWTFEEVKEC